MLVSYCSSSKLPQTLWFKTTQVHHIVVRNESLRAKIKVSAGLFLLELLEGGDRFFVFFAFLSSKGCPQPVAHSCLPSSQPAMADWVFYILCSDSDSSVSPFRIREHVWFNWAHLSNPGYSSNSNSICFNFLLPSKVTCTRSRNQDTRTSPIMRDNTGETWG